MQRARRLIQGVPIPFSVPLFMAARDQHKIESRWQLMLQRAECLAQEALQSVARNSIAHLAGNAQPDARDRQPIAGRVDDDPAAVLTAPQRIGTVEVLAAFDVQEGRES